MLTMFNQSTKSKPEENYTITQKDHSIYYALSKPTQLKAIEISEDLYRVKFYFSEIETEQDPENYELTEERRRIRGVVSSAVSPRLSEIGIVCTTSEYIEISGMKAYSSMVACNRDHISETFCIDEQLHPLEWILTKARNSGILPNDLYEKIRIDVRHRTRQIQEVASANQNSYQATLAEVRKEYLPAENFKPIRSYDDVHEFAGQVVAYLSDSYYFSNEYQGITLPVEVSGRKIRFAKIRQRMDSWQRGEYGYEMDCFLKLETSGHIQALVNSEIKQDSALAMRLATVPELEFLKLTLELDQGRLGYREKENDIKMLEQKIFQALKATGLIIAPTQFLFFIIAAPTQFSCFTPRTSAAIPPFMPFANGVRDWRRESESKDKSEPPKPYKVYLIKGGNEESRREKAYELESDEVIAMYGTYHNKDKSECAVVFSSDHDTFNLMNFDLAKKLAGQVQLPLLNSGLNAHNF